MVSSFVLGLGAFIYYMGFLPAPTTPDTIRLKSRVKSLGYLGAWGLLIAFLLYVLFEVQTIRGLVAFTGLMLSALGLLVCLAGIPDVTRLEYARNTGNVRVRYPGRIEMFLFVALFLICLWLCFTVN